MAEIKDFKALRIVLASPEKVLEWSHGEVTKPETINYRTLKPEKDGLFDERIFGPTKDWECYCGKYKRIRYRGVICDKCGVEVTQSRVRRERLGHISLASPVLHVWFFKSTPSKLSLLLDVSPKNLESVIYFTQYLVTAVDEDKRKEVLASFEEKLQEKVDNLKEEFENKIADEEKALVAEKKKLSKKGEQLEIALNEIELRSKAKVAKLREDLVAEIANMNEASKLVTEKIKDLKKMAVISEDEYFRMVENDADIFFEVGMGAESILKCLKEINLSELSAFLREEIGKTTGQKLIKMTKRLKIVESLRNSGVKPEWMVIHHLPVIPPDLRPMVQLSGGRFATSDLNDLYRRVINRNNRLRRLTDLGAPEIILRNEKRMLQEAVDSLIDTSQRPGSRSLSVPQLRSLSDMLRGKQGRFRQNLLGKRVDYSGRSVIIVGPDLALNQCKLPKEMALELFKPYVLHELIEQGYAPNVKSAKHVLERRGTEVWDILEAITKDHPVLLNRAPTLHRLGIQAFYPLLTEGNAIAIHPSVCAGYGADFDGDQMAVHVPLSKAALRESVDLMMTNNNLLRPADGEPIMTPTRDVFLGCYYLTQVESNSLSSEKTTNSTQPERALGKDASSERALASGASSERALASGASSERAYAKAEAIFAHQIGQLPLRKLIKVDLGKDELVETTVGRIMFNNLLPDEMEYLNKVVGMREIKRILNEAYAMLDQSGVVELIDRIKNIGFRYATVSGVSLGVFDAQIIPEKDQLIAKADKEVEIIEKNYQKGLISETEKTRLSEDVWSTLTAEIDELTWKALEETNPLKVLADSGARGSRDQIKQIAGMRGLMADPLGRIVELPMKNNFREGIDVYEYFTSTRGGRKGLVDKALKTAEAGYLTRRLVDVAHDVIVREVDCGTQNGTIISPDDKRLTKLAARLVGRFLATDAKDEKGKVLVKGNTEITDEIAKRLEEIGKEVVVRSPLNCETKYGICQHCYGRDLSRRKLVEMGIPVGVMAAQSIGEPGTQLTMRTFHTGGIIGVDITQGLPRVEELFEARSPKTGAVTTEIPGKVAIAEEDEIRKVVVTNEDKSGKSEKEYVIPATFELLVKEGDLVAAGDALTEGHLDLRALLETKGQNAVQQYIISEVQKVYESQGANINDKHFEVIIRKMSEKVKVGSSGDTTLLSGEIIDRTRFLEENARILASGGEPATAQIILLGITRAALHTESVLSAASFIETIKVLSDTAVEGRIDYLRGLKENVIIGRLIPTVNIMDSVDQEKLMEVTEAT